MKAVFVEISDEKVYQPATVSVELAAVAQWLNMVALQEIIGGHSPLFESAEIEIG